MFVLDTNVVSEAMRPDIDPHCKQWIVRNGESCFVTTITLAELRYGVERLPPFQR